MPVPVRSVILAALLTASGSAMAQAPGGGGLSGGPDGSTAAAGLSGQSVGEVRVVLDGGDPGGAIAAAARRAFGLAAGDSWNEFVADQGLARVLKLGGVAEARYRLVRRVGPDGLTVVLDVKAAPGAARTEGPSGILTGDPAAFPVLYRDRDSYARVILNGGFGLFSDGNPWFGNPKTFTLFNPLVQNPPKGARTGARASWSEGYVEYGLGGVTRLGDSPVYLYGAATVMSPWAVGRDIFRDDPRTTTTLEKAYAGVLILPEGSDFKLNASAGRLNFTLNDGFLISQFGSQWNAGPRPAVYLAPRTTQDFGSVVDIRLGPFTWKTFFLNPNEYEPLESRTHVAGTNLRYNFTEKFYVDASVIGIPQSDTVWTLPTGATRGREGSTTLAGHLRWADPALLPGVWVEAELAHQSHRDYAMSAWAGYGLVGYLAKDLPWTPSLSWRFAAFQGDDPRTRTFERFDTLYSGGLNEWLQGISINKALSQANRETHRLRANLSPFEGLDLTFDYYWHRADSLSNVGAHPALRQLRSRDLGQEAQLVARWAISRNVYYMAIAGHAMPGDAIRLATPKPAKPWSTLQSQLFWTF